MPSGHVIALGSAYSKQRAHQLIEQAPSDWLCEVKPRTRSSDQNAKMWAMLSDISRAKPEGRRHTTEQWKCLMMHACGYEIQFLNGLNGEPFPAGFRSSRLSVTQMAELISFIQAKGDEWGVRWSDTE